MIINVIVSTMSDVVQQFGILFMIYFFVFTYLAYVIFLTIIALIFYKLKNSISKNTPVCLKTSRPNISIVLKILLISLIIEVEYIWELIFAEYSVIKVIPEVIIYLIISIVIICKIRKLKIEKTG